MALEPELKITTFAEGIPGSIVREIQQSNNDHIIFGGELESLSRSDLFAVQLDEGAPLHFEDWIAQFDPPPAIEDPDQDGLPAPVEFLYGTSPIENDPPSQQRVGVKTIAEKRFATFSFPRQRTAEHEVTVEHSADVGTWIPIASNSASGRRILPILGRCVLSESDGEVRLRSTVPLGSAPRQQFRIRVVLL